MKLKELLKKYKHGIVLSYMFVYFIWFFALEESVTTKYTSVKIWLDDLIPFHEIFVIPYVIWFAYIAGVILYFFLTSKEDFLKCCGFLFTGMTICLIIYTIWPNGQDLRVTEFPRDNFLTDIVKNFYRNDTPTNVCPSIHCFNSIGVHIAIMKSQSLKNRKLVRTGSGILCVLICLSTVFIKQHSAFDGICAIILSAVMYLLVYVPDYNKLFGKLREGKYSYEQSSN